MSRVLPLPDLGQIANAAPGGDRLPDNILEYAVRMFLPEVPGRDLAGICRAAIAATRDPEAYAKSRNLPLALAKWRTACPLHLANHVMLFCGPDPLAGQPKFHAWHDRLRQLMGERERRFFVDGDTATV